MQRTKNGKLIAIRYAATTKNTVPVTTTKRLCAEFIPQNQMMSLHSSGNRTKSKSWNKKKIDANRFPAIKQIIRFNDCCANAVWWWLLVGRCATAAENKATCAPDTIIRTARRIRKSNDIMQFEHFLICNYGWVERIGRGRAAQQQRQ